MMACLMFVMSFGSQVNAWYYIRLDDYGYYEGVIKDGEYKFNYRVAAVFVNKDKILLQSTAEDSYLALPGGRVKYNETTIEALKRDKIQYLKDLNIDEKYIIPLRKFNLKDLNK